MSSSSWSVFLTPTVDTRNLCATGPPAFGATTDPEEDAGETIIDHIMNPTRNPKKLLLLRVLPLPLAITGNEGATAIAPPSPERSRDGISDRI